MEASISMYTLLLQRGDAQPVFGQAPFVAVAATTFEEGKMQAIAKYSAASRQAGGCVNDKLRRDWVFPDSSSQQKTERAIVGRTDSNGSSFSIVYESV